MSYMVLEMSKTFPSAVVANSTPPTFAGISGLVANPNGSLTASWSPATGPVTPIRYRIYVNSVLANLFTASGFYSIAGSQTTSFNIYNDSSGNPLTTGTTYYVGIRAMDANSIVETNTVSLNAVSAGIADNSVYNLLTTVNSKIGAPVSSVSSDIASVKSDSSTLVSRLTSGRAGNLDNLDAAISTRSTNTDMQTVLGRLTAGRAGNLDNLDVLVSSRASQTSVDSIQNNTTFVGQVPNPILLPDTGTKLYMFYVRLFNEAGQPTNPDGGVMNVTVKTTSGTAIVPSTAMTSTGVGLFEFQYTVSATDPERPLVVFFNYTRSGVPFEQTRTTEVQEYETKLDILLARLTAQRALNLDNLDAAISSRSQDADMQTILSRLTSQRALNLDNLDSEIAPIASQIQAIKGKTDQLQFNSGNVVALAQIVADKTGYSLTSAQVIALVAAIWDEALANHLAAGSMGKALNDSAYSGTGITPIDLQNIANYIWNEPRSMHTQPYTFGEANQGVLSGPRAANLDNLTKNVSLLATLDSVAILQLFSGTRIGNLDNLDTQISTRSTQGSVDSIKTDTVKIPANPATQAAVQAIPTDPLRTGDTRLNVLDAPISSRSQPSDLNPLATATQVATGFTNTATAISNVQSSVNAKPSTTYIDNAVAPLAKSSEIAAVSGKVDQVHAAQFEVQDVWSYATRTLTQAVETTVDLTGIARTTDVNAARDQIIDQTAVWKVRMTAAIDPTADTMELVAWLTKNDVMVLDASQCTIDVQDGDANLVMEVGPDMMIAANGVFKFTRGNISTVLTRNQTYTCNVKIVRDSVEYSGLVPLTVF